MAIRRLTPVLFSLLASAAALGAPPQSAREIVEARNRMVDDEIVAAGVKDSRVIESMRATPRHEFVAMGERANAYYDMALPIGDGQTISPPFVVAYMTEQLAPKAEDKVLEIGTGSGYQAAVLSPLVKEVYSIEIVKPLGERAARVLKRLKYPNVQTKVGDGFQGWPEHAPFDKIIVTCSPEKVPQALIDQLKEGGRMIVPVGQRYQQTLYLFEKKDGKLVSAALLPTLFVPMTGKAESGRVVKPDPANPSIANGSFEEIVEAKPSGWHYQRQLELVESKDAPEGKHYVTFSNTEPGRGSRALQGLAVDGRKVGELEVSLWVRAKGVRQGNSDEEQPVLGIVFYDENRAQAGGTWVPEEPWRGTFDWREEHDRIKVPQQAREAIVRIGLHGATGEVSFDDLRIKPIKRTGPRRHAER